MTLSPGDRRSEGIDGPAYPLNIICVAPGCDESRSLQTHHLWRRSDVGKHWWVKTSDGELHGNCVRVCGHHHRDLTDNIARIVYHESLFWWKEHPQLKTLNNIISEPLLLDWQPPGQALYEELCGPGNGEAPDPVPVERERSGAAHVLTDGVHEPDVCPTCLRKLPKPRSETPEKKKVRKTWSIAIPLDRYENGAEVLDTLLKEAHVELNRLGLPYGEGKVVNYYILSTVLGLFVSHSDSIMSDA